MDDEKHARRSDMGHSPSDYWMLHAGQRAGSLRRNGCGTCPVGCTWRTLAAAAEPVSRSHLGIREAAALANELGEERSELEQQAAGLQLFQSDEDDQCWRWSVKHWVVCPTGEQLSIIYPH